MNHLFYGYAMSFGGVKQIFVRKSFVTQPMQFEENLQTAQMQRNFHDCCLAKRVLSEFRRFGRRDFEWNARKAMN
jgi:hypothetical protein